MRAPRAQPASQSRRANALDVGRGLAIVSVMYGHALAPWFMGAGEHFSEAAFLQWKFGAAFMMPFFFFLSGASWREHRSLATTLRQAGALVLITWLASVALNFFFFALGVFGVAPAYDPLVFARDAARMLVFADSFSMSALWFLVALAVIRVIAAIAARFGQVATWTVTALLLAATIASTEYEWRNVYQLNLIGVAFLAFVTGHAMRVFLHDLERWPSAAFALMLTAGAVTIGTYHLNDGCRWDLTAQCGQDWLEGRFGVSMVIGQFGNLPLFFLTAGAGVLFAASLSILLARFGGVICARLAAWGRNSLNLLIANCLLFVLATPFLILWARPNIAADSALFFVALLALVLVVNLAAAALLARPLRLLQSTASRVSSAIVDAGLHVCAIVGVRRLRVSQEHD